MEYRLEDVADLLSFLVRGLGLKIAVIGSTALYYHTGARRFSEDLDLYVYEGSIIDREESLRQYCVEKGCDVGATDLGTPKLAVKRGDEEIEIEIYENIFDFYIPIEMIEKSRDVRIGDSEIKILLPEYYIVLKARTGSEADIEKLALVSDLVRENRLRINTALVREAASLFEGEDKMILSRIRSIGIRV